MCVFLTFNVNCKFNSTIDLFHPFAILECKYVFCKLKINSFIFFLLYRFKNNENFKFFYKFILIKIIFKKWWEKMEELFSLALDHHYFIADFPSFLFAFSFILLIVRKVSALSARSLRSRWRIVTPQYYIPVELDTSCRYRLSFSLGSFNNITTSPHGEEKACVCDLG